jgi:hypothetical protein
MSNVALVEPVDESETELDDRILELRKRGLTMMQIARLVMLPQHEVVKRYERMLPVIDGNYRRRAISESLVTIDSVIAEHMKTLSDPESASVVIRATCERRALLGVTGSTDPVMLSVNSRPEENSNSAINRSLALIEKMRRLANEKPSGSPTNGQGASLSGPAVSE